MPSPLSPVKYNPHLFTSMPSAASVLAFAHDRITTVDSYISGLENSVLSLVAPVINPEFPTGASAPAVEIPQSPMINQPVWIAPAMPAAFTGGLDVSDLVVAPFDEDAPLLSFGPPPSAPNLTLPDAPAIDLTYVDPTLTVTLPQAPSLLSINISPFGGVTLPTFDAATPVLNLVAPSIREYTPGAQYTSALLTQLQSTLLARISGGGTGLGQQAETAIWDRGREREARGKADGLDQLDQMESLGYMLPPGAYVDARLKLITEMDYANRGNSREVMVESARLELDNVKHALTTATQLEGQLLDYTNNVEQRLFESARYATEAGVSIYNAQVQAFASQVEIYRAQIAVYQARMTAALSAVDVYRAQVAAEQAKAEVNNSMVANYQAQITAALSTVQVYQAQIAGIRAKADIQLAKVQVFGAQVQAYGAQVNAYTAGVEGYRVSLQAETTKQDAYRTKVTAFSAVVDASAKQIEARVSVYNGQINAKNNEYDAFRAAVQGESARIQGIAATNGAVADAYRAEVEAVGAYNEVLTKQWQATIDQNQRVTEIGVTAAKANAELYITTRSLALDAAKTGATVAAQIGAASVNALNYSASMSSSDSYSGSDSSGYSYSQSDSTSLSSSTSTSTSTNISV